MNPEAEKVRNDLIRQALELLHNHLVATERLTHYSKVPFYGTPFEPLTFVLISDVEQQGFIVNTFVDAEIPPVITLWDAGISVDPDWKEIPDECRTKL